MKKLFVTVFTVILLLGLSVNTLAAPSSKSVEVSISNPVKVQTGEYVTLTAVTLKHGSDFEDEWVGATKVSTVLTEDGYYISTATTTANASVNVYYNIKMTTGNGGTFQGQASTSVEVQNSVSVVGVLVKNVTPLPGMTGFFTGDIYVVYSDGSQLQNGITYFGMVESQMSRNLDVSVLVNDIQYDFTVEISK